MHCCGTSRREGSNVSNPERKRTKSLASKQFAVDVPKKPSTPLIRKIWKKNYARIYKLATLSTKWLVWASDLLLQLPGIDTKEIKSDLVKQKCPKTPQNHSPLE